MDYPSFVAKVQNILITHGILNFPVNFRIENGMYFAYCPEGTIIIGNRVAKRVSVRWGSNHQAYTYI